MAILSDRRIALIDGATKSQEGDDVKLGDTSYNALTFEKNDRGYRVLVDPSTHFIRQIRIDRKAEIEKHGVEDVKTVDVTFDYLTTKSDEPAPEQFAWTPPRDATVAKEEVPEDRRRRRPHWKESPRRISSLPAIDGSRWRWRI